MEQKKQLLGSSEMYDVIVVGSGPNGSVAAKELGERGLRVLLLEAGPDLRPEQALNGREVRDMSKRLYRHWISKRQRVQSTHGGYWESNPDLFVDDVDNPYTQPEGKRFGWIRGRQVGGRSLTWGGVTLRLSDYEFKAASRDGYGEDWPISHGDLAPYYEKLERFFGIWGGKDGLEQLPDGAFVEAAELTPLEQQLKAQVEGRWSDRKLIASRGFHHPRFHIPTPEKPWPGLSSQAHALKAALATGFVELRANAVVSHVCVDEKSRKARGVGYIDRLDKTAHEVNARAVVLCASALETVRILLHSTQAYRAGGLQDAEGLLGCYLLDHIATTTAVFVPNYPAATKQYALLGSDSYLIPRFRNLKEQGEGGFLRGYGLWGGLQRGAFLPGFLRRVGKGSLGMMIGHGETLARRENRLTLSGEVRDAWGIPAAHIDFSWGENEAKMLADMRAQIREIVGMIGGVCGSWADFFRVPLMGGHIRKMERDTETVPGQYVHELGGARMGTSASSSVLNSYAQSWEVPNLFATDGACWVSAGWQNPTHTQMAITARTCDYLAKEMQAGHL